MDVYVLTAPPGYICALSYALSAVLFSWTNPPKGGTARRIAIQALLVAGAVAYAMATNVNKDYLYIPNLLAVLALCFAIIALTCKIPARNSLYFTIYAFLMGEFLAALSWHIFLFFVDGDPGAGSNLELMLWYGLTALVLLTLAWLYERRYVPYNAQLRLNVKTILSTFWAALGVFLFSNISNVYRNTPFSGQTAFQINLIRVLADAGGFVLLEAVRMLQEDISRRMEVKMLQKLMAVQYNNYRVSEQSIALVHQKYHDLKHQIAWLRGDVTSAERRAYLDRMEEDIRAFEAESDTGNYVLDTILTAKQAQLMYRYFRDHGYACASINYRLAQEAPFPAGLTDCKAAIRFLRAHAGEYGYDAEHIAVFGESAGGYLAVMCGVTEDGEFADVAFLGQEEAGDVSAKVDVVVNYYGHIDHSGMEDDWAALGIPQTVVNIANSWVSGDVLQGFENIESFWFRKNVSEMTAEEYAYSDPSHYIEKNELTGLAMWIVHGDCDITVPYLHSERLAAKLAQKLGMGAVSYHLIPGMGHASDPLYFDELLGQLKDYLDQMLE